MLRTWEDEKTPKMQFFDDVLQFTLFSCDCCCKRGCYSNIKNHPGEPTRVDRSQLEPARNFDLENTLGIILLASRDQTLLYILAVAIDRVLRLVRIVEVDEWVEETRLG